MNKPKKKLKPPTPEFYPSFRDFMRQHAEKHKNKVPGFSKEEIKGYHNVIFEIIKLHK